MNAACRVNPSSKVLVATIGITVGPVPLPTLISIIVEPKVTTTSIRRNSYCCSYRHRITIYDRQKLMTSDAEPVTVASILSACPGKNPSSSTPATLRGHNQHRIFSNRDGLRNLPRSYRCLNRRTKDHYKDRQPRRRLGLN